MAIIKNLDVKVTYEVGLSDLVVPDEVFEELTEMLERGFDIDGTGDEYPIAVEWLRNNIKEEDCCDLEYEISDLS